MEVMAWALFPMMVYLIAAMPSKKYLRRLIGGEERHTSSLIVLLNGRLGQPCTLVFDDAIAGIGTVRLSGTLVDIDDMWACMECADEKTGDVQLKVVRLSLIRSLEE